MTTSAAPFLSKPAGRERIDSATLGYFRQLNRAKIYNLVIDEFEKSGLTQADLALRLGKGTDQICRWLGSPGNWTVDTASDLLFAIRGGVFDYDVRIPFDEPLRNFDQAEWAKPAPKRK